MHEIRPDAEALHERGRDPGHGLDVPAIDGPPVELRGLLVVLREAVVAAAVHLRLRADASRTVRDRRFRTNCTRRALEARRKTSRHRPRPARTRRPGGASSPRGGEAPSGTPGSPSGDARRRARTSRRSRRPSRTRGTRRRRSRSGTTGRESRCRGIRCAGPSSRARRPASRARPAHWKHDSSSPSPTPSPTSPVRSRCSACIRPAALCVSPAVAPKRADSKSSPD